MRFMNRFSLLAAGLALVASSHALADPVIQNGGFESGDFTGWTQGGNFDSSNSFTSVTASDPGNGYYVNSGSYAAALGPNGTQGTLSQSFSDTAGQQYNLEFYLHGDANDGFTDNSFNATVGSGAGSGQLSLVNVLGEYQLYSVSFTGSGTDPLSFAFLNNDNYLNLDDVSIVSASTGDSGPSGSPVPEPSSLLLLGTGAMTAAGFARSKARNA